MNWGGDLSAISDFDFLIGKWRIRHTTLSERLVGCTDWQVANAIDIVRPAFSGLGNIGHFVRVVDGRPFCGSPIRLYDTSIGQWRIWWLDSIGNRMESPVIGRFVGREGTFEGCDTLRGKPIQVRFHWSGITPTTATWKQSFSADGGNSWELNSIMEFTRDDDLPDDLRPGDIERIFSL